MALERRRELRAAGLEVDASTAAATDVGTVFAAVVEAWTAGMRDLKQ